ncbi:MAG: isoprenylcysteine carboxylmethyltransferase family protein [Hyphomonadaceae bacterium]|nr:isoprenylcysteine carboxylmethyltransferase family protein [Hyphomonadaceae bacterium]
MSEMNRNEALIGSAAFFVVAPFMVAGVIPWMITHWRFGEGASAGVSIAGGVIIALAAAVLIECFVRFALKGAGTPAPLAPTKTLVVSGAYAFVRNPMYVAVTSLIFGQALLFASAALIAYAITIAFAFMVFVIYFEEPRLTHDFPDEYPVYSANVPRWRPRFTPWRP